jgi:hypothetical protein
MRLIGSLALRAGAVVAGCALLAHGNWVFFLALLAIAMVVMLMYVTMRLVPF